ncbi:MULTISPECIES: fimbrial protein [Lysobacter]|uniref:Fimbrial protein n=2 Tax=Lysobacter TaxID=68 RepID=A0A0S2DQN9_LYSEN|nr:MULTISPECIES: fimbrial protein [Lysobacter]ALN60805.1 fimbrial protein [Lysobacter enzymogenes]QCW24376.1 type 1 fimbrial protein [Lysobacter enzymogenes]QQQ01304.1 type 1 fimbrial protein [Lysobacter enzymogenes]UZW60558.1 type 1 fimbrial protein [Lysobacter enzymogenes]WMT04443.1 fimbrial protein [Lysobacter yananisis]
MKTASIAVLALALAAPVSAYAVDGTIHIEGSVIAPTCVLTNGPSPADIRVRLPAVAVSALSAAGEVAGRTPFIIRVADCDASTTLVQTFFEPGPTINTSNNNLTLEGGTGTAANVELQVLNADFSQVLLGNPLALQNSQQVAVDTGGAALRYYAQYYATGAASAGSANSSVTFTMIYQ